MRTYILRRIVHTIPVLLGVATVVFLALRLIPGDPAVALAGDKASVQEIAQIRESLGLNQPLPVQYVAFLGKIGTLQLGHSIRTGGDIDTELVTNFAPTIELSGYMLRHWTKDGLTFWAVSDIAEPELAEFAAAYKAVT